LVCIGVMGLWPASAAYAHGGPPITEDVLFGSGHISLVTSHGFFSSDSDWSWICEEATGADLTASAVRTPSRWFVGTTNGLRTSEEGCDWSDDPTLTSTNIVRVLQDVAEPERVWIATPEGVWLVDGAGPAVLETPVEFSVRHLGQREDGALLIVGFDGSDAVAQLSGTLHELPIETGRIEVLGADDQGRFYLRAPAGGTDRLIRVSEDGVDVILPLTDLIRDVATMGDDLYILYGDGVSWSADDGLSWSKPAGLPIRCLRSGADGFYACPETTGPTAPPHAPRLPADPAAWQWEAALDFSEVSESSCATGSTAGNVCPYLWPTVMEELGIPGAEPSLEPAPSGGCAANHKTGSTGSLILTLAGLLAIRRRSNGTL